jgi:6-pyruvoyltetrahydropterin/6-carboxytetrahydropterin synthase
LIRLIRRYDFSAAHVLARSDWSFERNKTVYGKCANPAGHGHNYGFELVLQRELDEITAQIVDLKMLDELVRERVLRQLDGKFLNRDVAAFASSVPTAENIARYIWDNLVGETSPARLVRVRLIETRNNSVEYAGEEPA